MRRSLEPCPDSPNCVSTQASEPSKRMPPLVLSGSLDDAWRALLELLAASPRTRVVEASDLYVHAECTSFVFRFVDDVEFLFEPERRLLHFRSASRVGHSDLGANRRRMTKLCRRLVRLEPFAPSAGP